MGLMRSVLLAASRSSWLRRRATRHRFVRRAVRRFMPGETLEEALAAAQSLRSGGIAAVLTCLGENVATREEAAQVARHYVEVLDRVEERGLDAEISVKLTHLGLDLGGGTAAANLATIARRATAAGRRVWIDMEGSAYTDATLAAYHDVQRETGGLGLCLQAYLRRTRADLEALLPLGPAIRLVKGAYREPPQVAFPAKRAVDAAFLDLAGLLLGRNARRAGAWAVFGTHDSALIRRVGAHAAGEAIPRDAFEFDLLYGIRRDEQERLAAEGYRVRVLIAYGTYWFPWYMRRLAERPANLWFVARSLLRP